MEATMTKSAALALAEQNMLDYFETHNPRYIAEDAVYYNMNTGETYRGREEISGALHYFYHVVFDAKATIENYIITEDKAMIEGYIRGKHIGDMGPIKATGNDVNFPVCVTYKLGNGLIKEAKIYTVGEVMMQQIGAMQ